MLLDLTDILFILSAIPLILVIFDVYSPVVGLLLLATFVANTYFMAKKRTPAVEVNGNAVIKNKKAKSRYLRFCLLLCLELLSLHVWL